MTSLTYAIGDIHGRLDLLGAALAAIKAHAGAAKHRVICLGDLVDRGPDSRGVVETIMDFVDGSTFICLKGNHENMMARALRGGDPGAMAHWIANGGGETLVSYGGLNGVPAAHLDWIEARPLFWRDAHRLFVHAGVAPKVALEDQSERSLLWIREAFLTAPAEALPAHVVHGHTPQWAGKSDMAAPELLPHRTNLDTGAVYTGVLSVGVFDDTTPGGPVEVLGIGV